MQPLAIAAIAIGLLAALAAGGWWAYAHQKKIVGKLTAEVKALKEGANARERQDKAEAEHNRVGDLNDDARFLHDGGGGDT